MSLPNLEYAGVDIPEDIMSLFPLYLSQLQDLFELWHLDIIHNNESTFTVQNLRSFNFGQSEPYGPAFVSAAKKLSKHSLLRHTHKGQALKKARKGSDSDPLRLAFDGQSTHMLPPTPTKPLSLHATKTNTAKLSPTEKKTATMSPPQPQRSYLFSDDPEIPDSILIDIGKAQGDMGWIKDKVYETSTSCFQLRMEENVIAVPNFDKQLIQRIIRFFDHYSVKHSGHLALANIISKYAFWTDMQRDVSSFFTTCRECQLNRCLEDIDYGDRKIRPMISYPFTQVHLDYMHVRNRDFDLCILIICKFTRFVSVVPVKSVFTIPEVTTQLKRLLSNCEVTLSKHPIFESAQFQSFLQNNNCKSLPTTFYHSELMCDVNRLRRELEKKLEASTKLISQPEHCLGIISRTVESLNNERNLATHEIPRVAAEGSLVNSSVRFVHPSHEIWPQMERFIRNYHHRFDLEYATCARNEGATLKEKTYTPNFTTTKRDTSRNTPNTEMSRTRCSSEETAVSSHSENEAVSKINADDSNFTLKPNIQGPNPKDGYNSLFEVESANLPRDSSTIALPQLLPSDHVTRSAPLSLVVTSKVANCNSPTLPEQSHVRCDNESLEAAIAMCQTGISDSVVSSLFSSQPQRASNARKRPNTQILPTPSAKRIKP